jgi:hypothetical protein
MNALVDMPEEFVAGWWDVSEADYHASPLVSRGKLYTLLREGSDYYQAEYEQQLITTDVTRAMRLGRLVHVAVLEPERWESGFCLPIGDVGPPEPQKPVPAEGSSPNTKEHRENLKRWRDEHAAWEDAHGRALAEALRGREVVSQADWDLVVGMANGVASNVRASNLLSGAGVVTERALRWVDEETGIGMRAKPDAYTAVPELVDLKSIGMAPRPENVARVIGSSWYHGQAAIYLDGFEAVTGTRPEEFVFVFVRSSYPFTCSVYPLRSRAIELGRREYRKALRDLKECRTKNDWTPPWGRDAWEIDVPYYLYQQSDVWTESFDNG